MIDRSIRDKLIVDSMSDWILELNIVTGETITSDMWKKSLGYDPDEASDNLSYWLSLIHPEDISLYKDIVQAISLNRTDVIETEFRFKMKSGDYKWILIKGKVLRGSDNKALYIAGTLIDTTDQRRAEENEKKFRNLVELSPQGVFTHSNGVITYANRRSMELLRVKSMDEIVGKHINNYLDPFYSDLTSKRRELLASGNSILPMEVEVKRPDGSKLVGEVATITIPDKTGLSCLSYFKDMTEHKLILQENKRLLDQAWEYDRLKTEFFSNISHELRTPINIMLSSIQLLNIFYGEKNLNPDRFFSSYEKYIGGMQQNSYRLLKLINNLIDLTKFDSGFFKMDYINLNIIEIIEDIAQSVAPYIESKKINFVFDTDVEEKLQAVDVLKLERILLNLLSNAVKFTPQGGTIEVSVKDMKERTVISVKDTGCGIPENKLELIFERFRQVDSLLTRRAEGSGIGLSLVKALVEAHDGSITVTSALGKGSEFIIELPSKTINSSIIDLSQITSAKESKIERINVEFSDIYS